MYQLLHVSALQCHLQGVCWNKSNTSPKKPGFVGFPPSWNRLWSIPRYTSCYRIFSCSPQVLQTPILTPLSCKNHLIVFQITQFSNYTIFPQFKIPLFVFETRWFYSWTFLVLEIDWLIDYIRVRDLAAPLHLCLMNGPFVPHVKITGAL
jgi:hypothetical protein